MFEPRRFKIGDLLNSSTKFAIPRYQRDYKWGKEEAQELIEDLNNYSSSRDSSLFLGTIILEENKSLHDGGAPVTMIVDGQQRITSILILLLACRQHALIGLKEEKLAQTILNKVAYIDQTTGEVDGPRLVASESVRDLIDHISQGNWDGAFPAKLKNKSAKKLVNRIQPVYDTFFKAIRGLNKEGLREFLRAIYDSLVIRIDIDDDEEALNIFERTNARGMELEISDLLKNYLFAKKVEGIEQTWESIVTRADGTLLRMLKYFYVSRQGYIQKAHLYRQLKLYARNVQPERMTEELHRFSGFYQIARRPDSNNVRTYFEERGLTTISSHEELSNSICRALQALNEFKVTQFIPPAYAVIAAIEKMPETERAVHEKALERLFKAFEKLHFVNNVVCDRVGNEVERFYADICEEFGSSTDLLQAVNGFIQQMSSKRAKPAEFEERFTEINYENVDRGIISYVFDRMMNAQLKGGQRIDIYNPNPAIKQRNNNIEHFLPVNGASSKSIDSDALHNIGNLLYLSRHTNSSLGNLSPAEKIEKLQTTNEMDIQNNLYVRAFIAKYGPMARDWNQDMIRARAREMAQEAYSSVWHF